MSNNVFEDLFSNQKVKNLKATHSISANNHVQTVIKCAFAKDNNDKMKKIISAQGLDSNGIVNCIADLETEANKNVISNAVTTNLQGINSSSDSQENDPGLPPPPPPPPPPPNWPPEDTNSPSSDSTSGSTAGQDLAEQLKNRKQLKPVTPQTPQPPKQELNHLDLIKQGKYKLKKVDRTNPPPLPKSASDPNLSANTLTMPELLEGLKAVRSAVATTSSSDSDDEESSSTSDWND